MTVVYSLDIERAKTYLKTTKKQETRKRLRMQQKNCLELVLGAENLRRLSAQQQQEKDEVEKFHVEEYKPSIDATQTTPDPKAEDGRQEIRGLGPDSALAKRFNISAYKEIVEEGIDPTSDLCIKKLINVRCEIIAHKFSRRKQS